MVRARHPYGKRSAGYEPSALLSTAATGPSTEVVHDDVPAGDDLAHSSATSRRAAASQATTRSATPTTGQPVVANRSRRRSGGRPAGARVSRPIPGRTSDGSPPANPRACAGLIRCQAHREGLWLGRPSPEAACCSGGQARTRRRRLQHGRVEQRPHPDQDDDHGDDHDGQDEESRPAGRSILGCRRRPTLRHGRMVRCRSGAAASRSCPTNPIRQGNRDRPIWGDPGAWRRCDRRADGAAVWSARPSRAGKRRPSPPGASASPRPSPSRSG